jgi:hypothetical protein
MPTQTTTPSRGDGTTWLAAICKPVSFLAACSLEHNKVQRSLAGRMQAHIVAALPTKAFMPASTPTASNANERHVAPPRFDRVAHQNFVRSRSCRYLGSPVGVGLCTLDIDAASFGPWQRLSASSLVLSGSCNVREGCCWDRPIQRLGFGPSQIREAWALLRGRAPATRYTGEADDTSTSSTTQRQGRRWCKVNSQRLCSLDRTACGFCINRLMITRTKTMVVVKSAKIGLVACGVFMGVQRYRSDRAQGPCSYCWPSNRVRSLATEHHDGRRPTQTVILVLRL